LKNNGDTVPKQAKVKKKVRARLTLDDITYILKPRGLCVCNKNGPLERICDFVRPVADTTAPSGDAMGREVRFKTIDGKIKLICCPRSDLNTTKYHWVLCYANEIESGDRSLTPGAGAA